MESVHWIVDRTLGRSEGSYFHLIEQLERSETPHSVVLKPPGADYVTDLDGQPIDLAINGPVFIVGTMGMKNVAAKQGWFPGYADAPGQDELKTAWADHLLNHDGLTANLHTINPEWFEFFARPVEDSKVFTGKVFRREEFLEWRGSVKDIPVLIAPVKKIFAEFRLYVIGGKIVTGSQYKRGDTVFYNGDLDSEMVKYAEARIAEYCPRRAFCLDIAQVDGADLTYKVIETNALSSSAFYACDMGRFIQAINDEYGV